MLLSIGMMFKYSFDNQSIYELINSAVKSVLDKGYRTQDIFSNDKIMLSTEEMGNKVLEEITSINEVL